MEHLKTILQSKFKTISLIVVATLFSCTSLLLRIKLNKSIFYIFLIWNVFLAIIPYGITMYLNSRKQVSKFWLLSIGVVWLLFLPNAPYIITDFVHFKISNSYLWWLDILMLLSFSLTGLYLFYTSLFDMQILVKKTFKKIPIQIVSILILFLCGFGVYLGRFLRYNSWGILNEPQRLISDAFYIIINPMQHKEAWLFTLGFGIFLWIGYCIFKHNYSTPST